MNAPLAQLLRKALRNQEPLTNGEITALVQAIHDPELALVLAARTPVRDPTSAPRARAQQLVDLVAEAITGALAPRDARLTELEARVLDIEASKAAAELEPRS